MNVSLELINLMTKNSLFILFVNLLIRLGFLCTIPVRVGDSSIGLFIARTGCYP